MSAVNYPKQVDSTINNLEKWQVIDVKPEGVTLNDEFIKNVDRLMALATNKRLIKPDELLAYTASIDIRETAKEVPEIAPLRDAMSLLMFHIFISSHRSVTTGISKWQDALPPIPELVDMTLGLQAILKEIIKRHANL